MVHPFVDMELTENFKRNLVFVGISFLVVVGFGAAKNIATPNEPVNVGYTEVSTECRGLDAGICIGFEKRTSTTYNYDNYQSPEEGTENFYRKVESELMLRAYNTCNSSMSGYDWTSEVSYMNQSAEEWRQNENIDLLPCERTFYRNLTATR